jgi:hypothetical protein
MKKLLTLAFGFVVLSSLVAFSRPSHRKPMASATCFCKISYDDLTNKISASGVCLDLTGAVNKVYTGIFPQNDTNQTDCNTRCTTAAAPYIGSQSIAACACAAGKPSGTLVRAWSAVGNKEYKTAAPIGTLTNKPEVKTTICTCPAGWTSNTSSQVGGVTTDGKCKKGACGPNSIAPYPPDGTQIGSWGFTWGNGFYAWGTTANGGAPKCVTTLVSAAECKF